MKRICVAAILAGAILMAAAPPDAAELIRCDGFVVDVATAEIADKNVSPPDIYVAAADKSLAVAAGDTFKIFRRKLVPPAGEAAVQLYVGRVAILSVQGDIWIGRMIEIAKSGEHPHVRYETVMVGDCAVREAPIPASPPEPVKAPELPVEPRKADVSAPVGDERSIGLRHLIPSKVLFKFDSAEIMPDYYERLDQLAVFVSGRRPATIYIDGHADAMGTDEYNVGLSKRRAQAVADYLANKRGLDPGMFEIRPYGEAAPEATNDSEAGRQKNRRVCILLTDEVLPVVEADLGERNEWPIVVGADALAPEVVELSIVP
ncbi:MAG: OmpA family protein [Candidatus Abyssobacteria bacterium SURF_5]|uniref:OmpA family protein n=1 Tax=Abyssobacteria bacterium (strain SURF_5) TaxID=2093360 RepID=A0A3A4N9W1_ABYX5|nr:MAG: OmpA family protein [Candidatus Abyssubacteria bacterium SURF_5]